MTEHQGGHRRVGPRCWAMRMTSRDPGEHHRVSTPLELLFDLCFVVAVAQAAAHLHHGIAGGHAAVAVLHYGLVFFAIWWAWMNFTWFASAYDTDDVPYRLTALVQIAGVLVLAAGVPRAFEQEDFLAVTLGYALMRVGLVIQWLRAASADAHRRRTALRYAIGIAICQAGWLGLLAVPHDLRLYGWLVLVPAELFVPWWAERHVRTAWHPHHIAERYGLFTLIVLGESVLSATLAIQGALDDGHGGAALYGVIAGGLLLIFALWWIYFDHPAQHFLAEGHSPFVWGYGHLAVFAATAAIGAGLGVAIDQASGAHGHLPDAVADAAIAVPVAGFLLGVWGLVVLPLRNGRIPAIAFPVAAALVLAAIGSGWAVPVAGVVAAALVATLVLTAPQGSEA